MPIWQNVFFKKSTAIFLVPHAAPHQAVVCISLLFWNWVDLCKCLPKWTECGGNDCILPRKYKISTRLSILGCSLLEPKDDAVRKPRSHGEAMWMFWLSVQQKSLLTTASPPDLWVSKPSGESRPGFRPPWRKLSGAGMSYSPCALTELQFCEQNSSCGFFRPLGLGLVVLQQ